MDIKKSKNLIKIANGVYANQADPNFEYKKIKQGWEPSNPLEKINIFIQAGRFKEAESLCFKLLQYKNNLQVHEKLVTLLSQEKLLMMARRYPDSAVKSLYYNKVLEINPKNKEARGYFQPSSKKGTFLLAFLVFLLLFFGIIFTFLHFKQYFINSQKMTYKNYYNNTIFHTTNVPKEWKGKTLKIPSDFKNIQKIIHFVDKQPLLLRSPYQLVIPTSKMIGYVEETKFHHFTFWIHPFMTMTNGIGKLSSYQINSVRTAYLFYLSNHREIPPKNGLSILKSDVPQPGILKEMKYFPSNSPEAAIQPLNGGNVPYVQPYIAVSLQQKKLSLMYQGKPLLTTAIGQGAPNTPTPVGKFVVTGRLPSPNPVYGKHIFPLDYSHYALHGTDNQSRIGKNKSLGCVELPKAAVQKLYQKIPVGIPVEIEQGSTQTPPKNQTWFL